MKEFLLTEERNGWSLRLYKSSYGEFAVAIFDPKGNSRTDYGLAPSHYVNAELDKEFERIRQSRWSRDFKPKAWEIVRMHQIMES